MSILDRALRVGESKKFKAFERNVARINDFEPELELESDEELRQRYPAFLRERHLDGEPSRSCLRVVRPHARGSKRALGQRHFYVG